MDVSGTGKRRHEGTRMAPAGGGFGRGTGMRLAAALVHVFTGLGAVCALMAALSVAEREWENVFLWLGAAFLIDGIDGTFARIVKVKEQLPRFSGETLDLVVDYVTYVFVPVLALLAAGILDGALGLTLAFLILLSSLYHFMDNDSKAEDLSFVGFPAIWNIVAFYLFAFSVPAGFAAMLILLCVLLTFVPMKWVHPLRVAHLWVPTAIATILWSIAGLGITLDGFATAPAWAKVVLIGVLVYGVGLAVLPYLGGKAR